MTIDQFITWAGTQWPALLAFFVAMPLAAAGLNRLAGARAATDGWRHCYSIMAYLSCVPGMFAVAITLYSLFLLRTNLLRVDVLVYFLPIVSMAATLLVIRRAITFERIPGFGRLAGLMITMGTSFLAVLLLDRLRVLVLFGGSILWLAALSLGLYTLLRLGLRKLLQSGG
jgi:hypothetical protein